MFLFLPLNSDLLREYPLKHLIFQLVEGNIWSCIKQGNATCTRTAKAVYRKFETNIPRNETAWPQSQFLHLCFCERFICSHDRSAYPAAGGPIMGIYKSLTDT